MSAIELISLLTQLMFLLPAVFSLADLLRYRDRARLDIALMFTSLGAIVAIGLISRWVTVPDWLGLLTLLLLVAHPFLLVRLVDHFQNVPRPVMIAAGAGMVVTMALQLNDAIRESSIAQLMGLSYFTVTELYATLAFVRGSRMTAGVSGRRLRLVAIGTGLLVVTIIIFVVVGFQPSLEPWLTPVSLMTSAASAIGYYLGFAPPRVLREYWQLRELHNFLDTSAGQPATERGLDALTRLHESAGRSVDSLLALVTVRDNDNDLLYCHVPTSAPGGRTSLPLTGLLADAWHKCQPLISKNPAEFGGENTALARQINAQTLMAIPIATREEAWGLLLVFTRRRLLFAHEDIRLLNLFAEQTAVWLNHAAALERQQSARRLLEQRVAERTADLEARNEELDSFAHTVAHDLKSPLNNILNFAGLLELNFNRLNEEKRRHYLDVILASGRKMGHIINELLLLASVRSQEIGSNALNMSAILDEVEARLTTQIREREAVIHRPGSWPVAAGHAPWVEEIWVNYVSNAIKYGGPAPQPQVGASPLPDGTIRFWVRDNGPGLNQEEQQALFLPFSQLGNASRSEGHGLGLSIVRRIVDKLGGTVGVDSAPGKGSTFWFTLPAAQTEPMLRSPA